MKLVSLQGHFRSDIPSGEGKEGREGILRARTGKCGEKKLPRKRSIVHNSPGKGKEGDMDCFGARGEGRGPQGAPSLLGFFDPCLGLWPLPWDGTYPRHLETFGARPISEGTHRSVWLQGHPLCACICQRS